MMAPVFPSVTKIFNVKLRNYLIIRIKTLSATKILSKLAINWRQPID